MNGETDLNNKRFTEAVNSALAREKDMRGSIGTRNEKLLHAALKNYYAPFADEQEIKIGGCFADAANEDGIFEIQTRALYRLRKKLGVFLECSRVTVVFPVIREYSALYISAESGEVVKEQPVRKQRSMLRVFKELYSLRDHLTNENLRLILAFVKVEKRVYFKGETLPDLRRRGAKKKLFTEQIPLKLFGEKIFASPRDYLEFLPEELPPAFTKKELSQAANEASSSLRTELLRALGIIHSVGKKGNAIVYEISKEYRNG